MGGGGWVSVLGRPIGSSSVIIVLSQLSVHKCKSSSFFPFLPLFFHSNSKYYLRFSWPVQDSIVPTQEKLIPLFVGSSVLRGTSKTQRMKEPEWAGQAGRLGWKVQLEVVVGDSQARNVGGARRASDFRMSSSKLPWPLSENSGSFPGLCPLQTLGVL